MSQLDEILTAPRGSRSSGASSGVCVIACDDAALGPTLDGLFGAGTAVVRAPAGLLSSEVIQQAAAKAIFLDGCVEIAIVTHAGCKLASLSANAVLDAMKRVNVPRTAVPGDLRELVGASRDPRQAASELAEALRRSAYVPDAVLVHWLHIDEQGHASVVERGEDRRVSRQTAQTTIGGYQEGPAHAFADSAFPPTTHEIPAASAVPPAVIGDVSSASSSPVTPTPTSPHKTKTKPRASEIKASGELRSTLQSLRNMLSSRIPEPERQRVRGEMAAAHAKGAPASKLVRLALRPVLRLGVERQHLIGEISTLTGEMSTWSPQEAFDTLDSLLR